MTNNNNNKSRASKLQQPTSVLSTIKTSGSNVSGNGNGSNVAKSKKKFVSKLATPTSLKPSKLNLKSDSDTVLPSALYSKHQQIQKQKIEQVLEYERDNKNNEAREALRSRIIAKTAVPSSHVALSAESNNHHMGGLNNGGAFGALVDVPSSLSNKPLPIRTVLKEQQPPTISIPSTSFTSKSDISTVSSSTKPLSSQLNMAAYTVGTATLEAQRKLELLESTNSNSKSELIEAHEKIITLTADLRQARRLIDELEFKQREDLKQRELLKSQAEKSSLALKELKMEIEFEKTKHSFEIKRLETDNSSKLDQLDIKYKALEQLHENTIKELSKANEEAKLLRQNILEQKEYASSIQLRNDQLKLDLENKSEEYNGKHKDLELSYRELDALREHVLELESKLRQEETVRRQLHNTIQELKGNIRVFCRIRPLLKNEIQQYIEDCKVNNKNISRAEIGQEQKETIIKRPFSFIFDDSGNLKNHTMSERVKSIKLIKEKEEMENKLNSIERPIFPDHIKFSNKEENTIILEQEQVSASGLKTSTKEFPFSFDRIYGPMTTQEYVFKDLEQLIQSALDGYNVCVFAYGQTGSGKTFTMEGIDYNEAIKIDGDITENEEAFNEHNMGMIPRSVKKIFHTVEELKKKGWIYKFEAQYLEIYNETIRDLLQNNSNKKHEIKHNLQTNKTIVTDATTVEVKTPEEVNRILEKAAKNRAVASTNCNDRSSRSHSVFIFKLVGNNELTQEHSEGILNLIDLAGSERLNSSGSTGDRLKETQAINKSLSCLGDVINALANKESHIPYRNSKLTYLLQNSLGGNSKTLMFVNVSPLPNNFQETLCSLRFATKVNACQIGTAKRTIK